MGNYCSAPPKISKPKNGKKPNPFSIEYSRGPTTTSSLTILTNPTDRDIGSRYELGQELSRGEFRVTYLGIDREGRENLAWKSISKKKLRMIVDIEDGRKEADIMWHLPRHPNIVMLKDTYEVGAGEVEERRRLEGWYREIGCFCSASVASAPGSSSPTERWKEGRRTSQGKYQRPTMLFRSYC